jgi:hypothetical protein
MAAELQCNGLCACSVAMMKNMSRRGALELHTCLNQMIVRPTIRWVTDLTCRWHRALQCTSLHSLCSNITLQLFVLILQSNVLSSFLTQLVSWVLLTHLAQSRKSYSHHHSRLLRTFIFLLCAHVCKIEFKESKLLSNIIRWYGYVLRMNREFQRRFWTWNWKESA